MSKPLKVAGEVDAYCTRCKMILNHRIVSMSGTKPHQVLCLTCNSTHLFRGKAPGEKAEKGEAAPKSSRTGASPRGAAAAARKLDIAKREQTWEKAVSGKGVHEFKPYAISGIFSEGDLIRHKKFGDGLVTRVVDAAKIEILFRDEPRLLAQGLTA